MAREPRLSTRSASPGTGPFTPVLETLAAMGAVFLLQVAATAVGRPGALLFGLSADAFAGARPWAFVTTVYAHAGLGHLLANAVGLALFGPLVARRTTRVRFHGFFLLTGVAGAVVEVVVGTALGQPPVVLGASGAVFALAGYALAGNVLARGLLDRLALSGRTRLVALLVVVAGLTLATGSSRTALAAHATGLSVGLVAGRLRLLDAASEQPRDVERY
jgi:membrane associated rhomboid family serine protease